MFRLSSVQPNACQNKTNGKLFFHSTVFSLWNIYSPESYKLICSLLPKLIAGFLFLWMCYQHLLAAAQGEVNNNEALANTVRLCLSPLRGHGGIRAKPPVTEPSSLLAIITVLKPKRDVLGGKKIWATIHSKDSQESISGFYPSS